jgi:hypothetical protein
MLEHPDVQLHFLDSEWVKYMLNNATILAAIGLVIYGVLHIATIALRKLKLPIVRKIIWVQNHFHSIIPMRRRAMQVPSKTLKELRKRFACKLIVDAFENAVHKGRWTRADADYYYDTIGKALNARDLFPVRLTNGRDPEELKEDIKDRLGIKPKEPDEEKPPTKADLRRAVEEMLKSNQKGN